MKFKQTLPILFIFITLYVSCNKEEDSSGIIADEYDSNMIHQEFTPPLTLNFDSTENYYHGSVSIDIDLDNDYDIMISQRLLFDFDPKDRHDYTEDSYPFTRLILKDDFDVATKIHKVPMPRDESNVEIWVDTLLVDNQINHKTDWSNPNTFFNI